MIHEKTVLINRGVKEISNKKKLIIVEFNNQSRIWILKKEI
uniref:Cytochrome b6-f complex subunit PetP n=1 Tax=Polysiphonia infestans TaxID=2006978 RepID=A0A1Z1MEQ3_9FLOR|nr:cytochrome b6-f complex subunit PetP [Polysiphonia infestans]ARW64389.1 cytochrome b6-f complex subunit PetP [Polysiphonia infestans]